MRKKIYLRIIENPKLIDIFEEDIKKDKLYWKKHHNVNVRYFELKEMIS